MLFPADVNVSEITADVVASGAPLLHVPPLHIVEFIVTVASAEVASVQRPLWTTALNFVVSVSVPEV